MLSDETLTLIEQDITKHEGSVNKIYIDSEGYETFGIGHLVLRTDPEYGLPVGTKVSNFRVREVFHKDLGIALTECERIFPALEDYPQPVQRVLVNMTFNLGRPRLSKFKKMIKAVESHDWNEAAVQMIDSKWYRQVGVRGKELVELMRSTDQYEVDNAWT